MKKNKLNKIYAQGDVLLVPVKSIPSNVTLQKREDDRVILAYGEVTGHSHHIVDKNCSSWIGEDDKVWLEVNKLIEEVGKKSGPKKKRVEDKGVTLLHGNYHTQEFGTDHGEIKLPPGKYEVRQQREYVPSVENNVYVDPYRKVVD